MKVFHCDHCQHLVFFENTQCVSCGHVLAFLPDLLMVGSLDPGGGNPGQNTWPRDRLWSSPLPAAQNRAYRLCANYADMGVCNWAVPDEDPAVFCLSCRLTEMIPDLSVPGHTAAWYRLEVAKRRLIYTLLALGLPMEAVGGVGPLRFQFLADAGPDQPSVLTGHAGGIVTINVAEAHDAERERRRTALGEPYRTLLGHMRHEVGHYYWNLLVGGAPDRLQSFRALFGDERENYAASLARHYESGPPADWQNRFVSAYASAHPWEDWAEVWAHYLHMTDTVEFAAACGVSLRPGRADEPSLPWVPAGVAHAEASLDRLLDSWFPLTYLLNNLNRGLGLADAYPFVLSPTAVEKLRFVHETIAGADCRSAAPAEMRTD
jgi:hypothetical protein